MRCSMLLIVIAVFGCSQSSAPSASSPPATVKPPSFKPEFTVKWPGDPEEDSEIRHDKNGEEKEYTARWISKRPEGVLSLAIHVTEYSKKNIESMSAEEFLEASLTGGKRQETRRTKVVFGPQKYPGLDVTLQYDKRFQRRLFILADRYVYDLIATSKKEEWLNEPEVVAFFDSLVIK